MARLTGFSLCRLPPRTSAVVTLGGLNFLATASVRLCARKQSPKDGDISRRGEAAMVCTRTAYSLRR